MIAHKSKWFLAGLLCLVLWPISGFGQVEQQGEFTDQEIGEIVGRIVPWVVPHNRAQFIRENDQGPEHPLMVIDGPFVTGLFLDRITMLEAEKSITETIGSFRGLPGEAWIVPQLIDALGYIYGGQGRYAEADLLYKRALAIWEKAPGPYHLDLTAGLNNLAEFYQVQGRYTEAEPLYQRALKIREQSSEGIEIQLAISLDSLAAYYYVRGRYAKAEPLYARALVIWEEVLGAEHVHVALSLETYAAVLRETRRISEAAEMEARAKAIRAKHGVANPAIP